MSCKELSFLEGQGQLIPSNLLAYLINLFSDLSHSSCHSYIFLLTPFRYHSSHFPRSSNTPFFGQPICLLDSLVSPFNLFDPNFPFLFRYPDRSPASLSYQFVSFAFITLPSNFPSMGYRFSWEATLDKLPSKLSEKIILLIHL